METSLRQERQESIDRSKGGRKRKVSGEWIWFFQEQLRLLACDRGLTGRHWRVMAYLMSCATFAQDVTVRQREIAEALGMTQSTVSEMVRDLDMRGIIVRVVTHEYPATYRFNSEYVYKGHGEKRGQRLAYQHKKPQKQSRRGSSEASSACDSIT